jgi:integrase
MRIDELVNMMWADVDFNNGGRITLTDESSRGNTGGPRRTLKSGHSRSFPIYADFLPVLLRLPRIDKYVFHGPRRGRLKADTVRRVLVRDVLEPLAGKFPSTNGGKGFTDGRLHSFRHYFVSMCATNKCISERAVMEWVGHADSSMVRHYFHLHDEEARRQMQSLDLLGGAVGRSDGDVPKF